MIGYRKILVYLPKGKYRANQHMQEDKTNEFTIAHRDIEVNVSTIFNRYHFNINGWRDIVSLTTASIYYNY